MTGDGTVLLVCGGVIAAFMLCVWLLSLRMRDVSIVDVAWGLGIVVVAWVAFVIADGAEPRKALVVALTTVWGLRLTVYLAIRKAREREEDFRYREVRAQHGERFGLVSLFTVFAFQGLGMWTVSLPVQMAQVYDSPSGLTALDLAGVALWAVGMLFEAGGDLQLARFRADPANRGKLMDRGLWRYTRHPNYFGEFCVWWGLYLIALATGDAWWTVVGPLTITYVLTRMFGVTVMERSLADRKPGYAEYVRRTSTFFPRPPRG